ncbi:MAG: hypothetical protein J6C52_10595 [Clostridia bacterium]|nr:hypothetical protein [Clostridia bacterium]
MKKQITTLLLLASLLASLSACGGEVPSADTTAAPDTTAAEDLGPFPTLPETDLGGFTLRIASFEDIKNKYMYTEETTGDVVNDAIYNAVSLVSETFNANIEMLFYSTTYNDVTTYATPIIQAGDDVFDLIHGHDGQMWALSLQGFFHNIREFAHNDFSQPWWPVYANDEYEINDRQYIFTAYMSHKGLAGAKALLFNKGIAKDFQLEIPYQTVRDGKWTMDKMSEMVKAVYRDVNGNNTQDESDIYGMIGNAKLYGWQAAFVHCYAEDDKGIVGLDYDKERLIDATEQISTLLNGGEGAFITGTEPDAKMFVDGRAMFHFNAISTLTTEEMRASDVDYGVLPLPKFDDKQENYATPTFDQQLAVPVTAAKTGEISLMVEALNIAGYDKVLPAFFDTAMSVKYARDDETVEMLGIIRDTICADLAYMNTSSGTKGLGRATMHIISNPNTGIASYLDSIEAAELATIEKLNAFFAE